MDLLDFEAESLYFDESCPAAVDEALKTAALSYGRPAAEPSLLRAYFLAPDNLSVLVALYRFYFYQHRLDDALRVAERSIAAAAGRLGIDPDWRRLDQRDIGQGVRRSMGLTRFLLFAVKAMGLIRLRQGDASGAVECLAKVRDLDAADRIGSGPLLQMARRCLHDQLPAAANAG